jgi:ribokinase
MIVVFGSLNADLVFRVPSLPVAGETVLTRAYTVVPGGKGGNQAVAAARAGAATRMAGCVGEDDFGQLLLASLNRVGVDTSAVARTGTFSGCAAISVDPGGENQIAVAAGANLEARAANVPEDWLTPDTTLMLQMEVAPEENWALATRARERGARVILNAAPAAALPESVLRLLDVLIVNELEACVVARAAGLAHDDPQRAARSMAQAYALDCVVTLGGEGAAGFSRGKCYVAPPHPITPLDTTGAGDAFCGVFAASLDNGMDFDDALRRAGIGGALACTRAGAQTGMADATEIDALFNAPSTETTE